MEIALQLLSGLAWAYAYWRIIQVTRTDRSYGMPLFAAALNFTWELIYFAGGVLYWGDYGIGIHVQTIINGIWLALDVAILVAILHYGGREFRHLSRRSFYLMVAGAVLMAALFQASMLVEFDPVTAGCVSAWLQNAFMSGAFVVMAITRGDGRGQRIDIGVARLVGTLVPTLTAGLIGRIWPTVLILGASCAILDVTYLVVHGKLRRARKL